MINSINIAEIISRKIQGTITPDEQVKLDEWINTSVENLELYQKITNTDHQLKKLETYQKIDTTKAWQSFEEKTRIKSRMLNLTRIFRYAAAILIPLIISVGTVYFLRDKNKDTTLANLDEKIQPGSQKAILVLADGERIEINENESINLDKEGIRIDKKNKKLIYKSENNINVQKKLVFNELKTPMGGGYNLKLADGTEVWLNAGSSLKYPVEFNDTLRQVYLDGEAYFDVIKNGKTFIVTTESLDIRVLGTLFNVSAYHDDANITTTLVEGKVQVKATSKANVNSTNQILTPKMQAVYHKSDADIKVGKVDTDIFISWKDGKLEFNNDNLELVMKKLSRWYDFSYRFENEAPRNYHFTARISNTESISNILQMLEMTTQVKFEIEEETIVIK